MMKPLILPFLFLHQLLATPVQKAKYSKCIVEDAGNVEVSGLRKPMPFWRDDFVMKRLFYVGKTFIIC